VGATDAVWTTSLRASVFSTDVVSRSGKLGKITTHRRAQRSILEIWCARSQGYVSEAELGMARWFISNGGLVRRRTIANGLSARWWGRPKGSNWNRLDASVAMTSVTKRRAEVQIRLRFCELARNLLGRPRKSG